MNDYKTALKKIRATEDFKESTINLLTSKPEKVRRSRGFKAVSAIAASLAVIIGISAVLILPAKNNNSFTLTAYAAEASGDESQNLNNKSYVSVGKIKDFSMTTGFVIGRVNDKNEIIETYPQDGSTVTEAQHTFMFNLNCKGENIDTVTYDSGNGKFNIFKDYDKILNTTGKSKTYNGVSDNISYYCDSFTTKYDDQIWNVEPVFVPEKKGNQAGSEDDPFLYLETAYHNYEKDGVKPKAVKEFYDYYGDGAHPKNISKAEKKRLYEAYIDDFVKDLVVTVTAKFKDGSEDSKKIKFKCEFLEEDTNGAQFNLKAKIV